MRLPAPSPFDEFRLPFEDLETGPVPLRCFRFPEALENPRRTVICIPGMSASGPSFARLRGLSDRYDFRLICSPVEVESDDPVRDVAAAVAGFARAFDRPAILGTSFGGLVALTIAADHRDLRPSGLILAATFSRLRLHGKHLRSLPCFAFCNLWQRWWHPSRPDSSPAPRSILPIRERSFGRRSSSVPRNVPAG